MTPEIPFVQAGDWAAHRGPDCLYCGRKIFGDDGLGSEDINIDHIVPSGRNGPDLPFNKAATCALCNHHKGALLPSEFLKTWPLVTALIWIRAMIYEARAKRIMRHMGLSVSA